jgi:hypothetical protein
MVDLDRTEEQMLTEIECETSPNRVGRTGADERRSPDTPWHVAGHTPYEVLVTLRKALSKRYAHIPKAHLSANLLDLVKHGLGNAFKRGNGQDAKKLLTVTVCTSDLGAVVRINDQGNGFDARHAFERFARQERYFVHAGSGFSHFHKSTSVVSYADGGRTVLIRFLVQEKGGCGTQAKASKSRWIDFVHLRPRDQVKVKGGIRSDGSITAMKVSLKSVEELALIKAPLRHVDNARVIHILNSNFTLPAGVEIASAHGERLGFEALRAGQVVEMTGRHSFGAGFFPMKLQIENESSPEIAVLKGRIDEIDPEAGILRVLGITVTTDDQTELIDKR